jgi:PAS domain S-box-containing protein
MSALDTVWIAIAAACCTLAAIHTHVWYRQPAARGNAAFAGLAASVAALAFVELKMFHAASIPDFGRALWWYHVPVWSAVVALVGFVRLHLGAGSVWLGWGAIGLRTLGLLLNFASPVNINFREITALEPLPFLGDTVAVARGVPNPWMAVAQLSLLTLIAFVATAARDLWRRREIRRAITIGGSLVLFASASTTVAIASFWGLLVVPVFATLFFLPSVLAMGYELSLNLVDALRLALALRRKESELRGSEQKLTLAAEAANAGVWSLELATGRLWATPRTLAMLGLAPGRDHGMDGLLGAIHPDDRARMRHYLDTTAEGARPPALEFRVPGPGGDTRWYASVGGTHDEDTPPGRHLMGAIIDITERKRVEDEMARQRRALEHLSRVATLGELSGALAHELNQPLAIILSNAEAAQRLLDRPVPDLSEIRAILADIVAADQRAGSVIARWRLLLKRDGPAAEPLDVNRLVEGVLQFMRADLVRRDVRVETRLDAGPDALCADRVTVEQVLINVIGNACDAMAGNPPGERCLRIATSSDGSQVRVRVADDGPGLPDPPERVFEPFFSTKADGLGLGLAISRSIATQLGGRLVATAGTDGGAVFTLELPVGLS